MNSEERSNEEIRADLARVGSNFATSLNPRSIEATRIRLAADVPALLARIAAVTREKVELVDSLNRATEERDAFRDERNADRARIAAVEALHFTRGRNILGKPVCAECSPLQPMPCPTLRALAASPTPTGPEPAKCEHKRTEAHQMLDEFCEWTADCPGPATPEPTDETP